MVLPTKLNTEQIIKTAEHLMEEGVRYGDFCTLNIYRIFKSDDIQVVLRYSLGRTFKQYSQYKVFCAKGIERSPYHRSGGISQIESIEQPDGKEGEVLFAVQQTDPLYTILQAMIDSRKNVQNTDGLSIDLTEFLELYIPIKQGGR